MAIKHMELYENQMISEMQSIDTTGSKKPRIEVIGDVIIEDNLGHKTFTRNKFLIQGSVLAIRKLFNVDGVYNFKNLNQILSINPTPSLADKGAAGPRREDAVCLFAVGTGGSGDTFGSVNTVKYNEVGVSNIIPFRYTQTALSEADKAKYFMFKADGAYMAYYAKKFEVDPVLKCLDANGVEVPNTVENLSNDAIDTFIELKLKIDKTDCRDWFTVKGGGIEAAKVNTLSLLAGFPTTISVGVVDYVELKVVTKFNFKNEALENEKELYVTYRIYI